MPGEFLMRHPLAEGQQQRGHQCGVEPVGRNNTQHPIEQELARFDGFVAGRQVDDQPADDEEDVDPHGATVGEQLADGAGGVEVEEDLHEMVADHHPGGERPQCLKRIQHEIPCACRCIEAFGSALRSIAARQLPQKPRTPEHYAGLWELACRRLGCIAAPGPPTFPTAGYSERSAYPIRGSHSGSCPAHPPRPAWSP